jgi:predicted metal-binding membrane protein
VNLLRVFAIAAFVLIEKLAPSGETIARIGGAGLLLLATYVALAS